MALEEERTYGKGPLGGGNTGRRYPNWVLTTDRGWLYRERSIGPQREATTMSLNRSDLQSDEFETLMHFRRRGLLMANTPPDDVTERLKKKGLVVEKLGRPVISQEGRLLLARQTR
jgi:hypothetical protein